MARSKSATTAGDQLPLLPLRGLLIFPHMVTSFEVGRARSLRALEAAMMLDTHYIVLAAQRDASISEPGATDLFDLCTVAEIKQVLTLPEDRLRVLVEGRHRAQIRRFIQNEPYYAVQISKVIEPISTGAQTTALMRTTVAEFEEYLTLNKKQAADILAALSAMRDPSVLADTVAAQLNISVEEKQTLLELANPEVRLENICAILVRECEILEIEKRIQNRVRKQMEKSQREYYLREQIKAIQKELGDKDERLAEVDELRSRIDAAHLPKTAKEKAEHELSRLERMPPLAAEAVVIRNYLDWILALPWTKKTKDRLDIKLAEGILERDHYGLADVKERILEFLAVRQLTKKMHGPIMCLVGPPGVGKTSLAKSVAEALGRHFYRFSLGGVRDEAEIRGHRRTYIGAMPGKVIQAMRAVGSQNPVILLDEVDKMSSDFRGDPTSALLEVLDPEQNNSFGDHYMEITFDLSNVLFITTANMLNAIPRPLRDRMELIHLPGYTEEEKLEIARRHLLPKQMELHGLTPENIRISDRVLANLISGYTREAGVRSLERTLAAVCRKTARDIVAGEKAQVNITGRIVQRFLGQPRFRHTVADTESKVGVATGLAYTEVGGEILQIEVTVIKGRGRLILTGKLGEVMRESAQAAYSYVRSRAEDMGIDPDFNEKVDVHLHVPEGAVPKDGPSAGITIATALASALSGRAVHSDWAMTGEITLRGRVLPVGGIKEKLLAAYRAGVQSVVIPQENEKDLEDLPANIRKKMNINLVSHMDEVSAYVLEPAPPAPLPETSAEDEVDSIPVPEAWSADDTTEGDISHPPH